jgi:hypothetical protein
MQVAAAAGAAASAWQLPHCIGHVLCTAPLLQQRLEALGQRPGSVIRQCRVGSTAVAVSGAVSRWQSMGVIWPCVIWPVLISMGGAVRGQFMR